MSEWACLSGLNIRLILLLALGSACSACQHSDSDAQSAQDGERIFATVCARCHGADGKGGGVVAGPNAARNFHDAAFQAARSDEDLKQVIRQGKGAMPAFGALFSESDLRGLVHQLRSFRP